MPVSVISPSVESLRLYSARTKEAVPSTASLALIEDFGRVVDRVDNQFIVEADRAPAVVTTLTSAGIWIEKVPPALDLSHSPPSRRPTGDPGSLDGEISTAEIERTILDLQGMSSTDGSGVGSRQYRQVGNAMALEYLYRRFNEYDLAVKYQDFVTGDGYLGVNVIAELPAAETSGGYLLAAHFDTNAQDTNGDQTSAPGALDNATGVAVMLEVARVLSEYDLRYPVHFLATNVEEEGLQGAEAFGRQQLESPFPYDAAFNIDAVGSAAGPGEFYVNADGPSVWIQDQLLTTIGTYNLELDPSAIRNGTIVADDTPLSNAGIATVLIASELYGDPAMNQSKDTIEQVDLPTVAEIAAMLSISVFELAGT